MNIHEEIEQLTRKLDQLIIRRDEEKSAHVRAAYVLAITYLKERGFPAEIARRNLEEFCERPNILLVRRIYEEKT